MEDKGLELEKRKFAINTALRKLLPGSGIYTSVADGMYVDVYQLIENARIIEKYLNTGTNPKPTTDKTA